MGGTEDRLHSGWTEIIAQKVLEYNPHCSIRFKYHWKKIYKSRKQSRFCFCTKAICSFSGCPFCCTVYVEAYDQENPPNTLMLHLHSSTKTIAHKAGEKKARHIRGKLRQQLKQKLLSSRPSCVHHQSLLALSPQAIKSGNRDGVGITTSVMKKISSEGHKQQQMDSDLITSLMLLKIHNVDEQTDSLPKELIRGYTSNAFMQLHLESSVLQRLVYEFITSWLKKVCFMQMQQAQLHLCLRKTEKVDHKFCIMH